MKNGKIARGKNSKMESGKEGIHTELEPVDARTAMSALTQFNSDSLGLSLFQENKFLRLVETSRLHSVEIDTAREVRALPACLSGMRAVQAGVETYGVRTRLLHLIYQGGNFSAEDVIDLQCHHHPVPCTRYPVPYFRARIGGTIKSRD